MTWGRDTDEHEAADQLAAFLDAGGTLVDTAAGVRRRRVRAGDRRAARLDVVDREEVVIATKAGVSAATGRAGRRHLAPGPARRARRLAAPAGHRPRRPVAGARLERRHPARGDAGGARRRRGVRPGALRRASRTTPAGRPARAVTWQQAWPGRAPLVSTQMEYSLLQRGIEREVLPAAAGARPRRAAVVAAGRAAC